MEAALIADVGKGVRCTAEQMIVKPSQSMEIFNLSIATNMTASDFLSLNSGLKYSLPLEGLAQSRDSKEDHGLQFSGEIIIHGLELRTLQGTLSAEEFSSQKGKIGIFETALFHKTELSHFHLVKQTDPEYSIQAKRATAFYPLSDAKMDKGIIWQNGKDPIQFKELIWSFRQENVRQIVAQDQKSNDQSVRKIVETDRKATDTFPSKGPLGIRSRLFFTKQTNIHRTHKE